MIRGAFVFWTLWTVCLTLPCTRGQAESAIPLISGFDAERIESVYPPADEISTGELAKLLYRLRRVGSQSLSARLDESESYQLGDAISVSGRIERIRRILVPDALVEFLEFSEMRFIATETDSFTIPIITSDFPSEAEAGDRVEATGIVIEASDGKPLAIATQQVKWFPAAPESVGLQLLTGAGVDAALIAGIVGRDRRPLLSEDGDAFYAILSATNALSKSDQVPSPQVVDAVTLLRDAQSLSGQWLRVNLETVQVTRIAVTDPDRQVQLGSDHYYQIDAVGDLGDVVVKIEPPANSDLPAVTFENRYPISVVTTELPEFLAERIRAEQGGAAIVSQPRLMVAVNAFYYRLWSYESDFMNQRGGGEQFGPLLIAAQIDNREPVDRGPVGVAMIGYFAAAAIICGILATWAWGRQQAAEDRKVREKRQQRQSEQLRLPK